MTDPRTGSAWILGDKFDTVHPHLENMSALWNKKWKFPCERSLYPFHDGKYEDFAPIFESLIAKGINDGYTDEYTREFLPTCEKLVQQADTLQAQGEKQAAIDMYLRACAVYRLARFPYINSALKRDAYNAQKAAYLKGAALWEAPLKGITIPHTAGIASDEGKEILLFVRLPNNASPSSPVPAVLLMTGLDGHNPDNFVRTQEHLNRGWATVIADIPGTADCPADRRDPTSPDRLWTSVLDWMQAQGHFDMKRVLAWGLSAGGYNAARAAHTHADRLAGAVAQGAGTHHFFSRAWLEKAQNHEYPWNGKWTTSLLSDSSLKVDPNSPADEFPLALPALTEKYGYPSIEAFLANAQKDFSLLETGIVHKPSCRLLMVNGTHDGLMPIEDSMLLMEFGRPKEARLFTGLLHMGYPPANSAVYPWMEEVVAGVH